MADAKNLAKIRAQHKVLKDNLRQVQRDFGAFLRKTKNETGQHVRDGKDFYDRIEKKAAKDLNTFESKHDLDKYQSKPRKSLITPKSGGAGGRMMMPQEYSKRTLYKPKTN